MNEAIEVVNAPRQTNYGQARPVPRRPRKSGSGIPIALLGLIFTGVGVGLWSKYGLIFIIIGIGFVGLGVYALFNEDMADRIEDFMQRIKS